VFPDREKAFLLPRASKPFDRPLFAFHENNDQEFEVYLCCSRRQVLASAVGNAAPVTGVAIEKAVNTPPPSDTMEIQDDRPFGAI
jgi:hypothetical protein